VTVTFEHAGSRAFDLVGATGCTTVPGLTGGTRARKRRKRDDDYFSSGESWINTVGMFVVTTVVISICLSLAASRFLMPR
jgi:hypothetical protein